MKDLISKSFLAALFIAIGNYVLLKQGAPLGAFLFSLGLYSVCLFKANLFTGKCGYLFEGKIKENLKSLSIILAFNILFGFFIGLIFSLTDPQIVESATEKVNLMSFTLSFFIKSVMCGAIMFVAVDSFKRGSKLGILLGVPTFILCGFQHCIANIVTMGIANEIKFPELLLCIFGNLLGSLIVWYLQKDKK